MADAIKNKKRKEVFLDAETIELLEIQAKKQGRKLKNFMEFVLREKAFDFELSETYKAEMDVLLDKHKQKQIKYISQTAFKNATKN